MNAIERIYLISRRKRHVMSFLLHGGRTIEIHLDAEKDDSILGNIYIAKVKNIVKNIGAAFVEIAPNVVCYLALDDLKHPIYTKKGSSQNIQAGDELLVQVQREGIKTKAPAVTTNLTLHGKYALLTTGNRQISVSSKIAKEEKQRLTEIVRNYEKQAREQLNSREYGWLLRTNADSINEELLQSDLARLERQYFDLMAKVQYRTCYSCLSAKPQSYLARLSDLYARDTEKILTDNVDLYQELQEYLLQNQPEDLPKLIFYEDHLLPMEKLYSLEKRLSEALSERVWLKSGGYLVIQPTEALTVIDVNTGKYDGGKKKEAAFLKINQEAAIEIARQIRLRNLSGIILVDFINMEEKSSNESLLSLLDQKLREDPIRTVLVDMTKLSLVEITRMKRERPLHEVNVSGLRSERSE